MVQEVFGLRAVPLGSKAEGHGKMSKLILILEGGGLPDSNARRKKKNYQEQVQEFAGIF